MKNILAFLAVLLIFAIPIFAQDHSYTTFQWDLSADDSDMQTAAGGYRIYGDKQSGDFYIPDGSATFDPTKVMGSVAAGVNTVTIDTDALRGRWYFVASAFILDDPDPVTGEREEIESGPSNEVTAVFKPDPPGNLRKVVNIATFPIRKAGGFLAGLFSKRDLEIINN